VAQVSAVSDDVSDITHTKNVQADEPKLSKTGFFQCLTEYTAAEWEGLLVYCYRILPITDRQATGNTTKYVMKYGGPFDEDRLKVDAGSGRYQLRLNQADAKGRTKTIKTIEVEIEDPNFPPKVPEGEWLDDPRNKRWAWAKKKPEEAAAAAAQEVWTPERVMNMVERLRPQEKKEDQVSITREVLNAVKETRAELGKANDPTAMIAMLKDLILIAKPTTPEKPSEDSGLVKLLMAQLEASREDAKIARAAGEAERQRNHELQLKMMEQRANQADPMDMVEKVLNIQKKLGGGEPEAPRNWKEKLVDQGLEYVPQILDLAGKAIGSYQRGPAAAPRQQQQTPSTTPPPQQPPQQTQTQPPPNPQTGAEQMPPQQPADPDIAMLLPILEQQGVRLVNAFKADPGCGVDVAVAIASPLLAGPAGYERIARMGREKIWATIELIPQMKADLLAIGTQEMINEFIDDIIAGPDDEEEEDPPIPEATRQPPRSRKQAATATVTANKDKVAS
jgi:hypothetical protein